MIDFAENDRKIQKTTKVKTKANYSAYKKKLQLSYLFYRISQYQMECSDGFRRRAAIIASDNQILTAPELENFLSPDDNLGRDKFIKFRKINASNHAILNNRKKEEEFKKTIKEIENRKCTFYRMGFRSYEKNGQNKLFGQVLGMNSGQMKGTMYVGELWANHEVGKFFRENKICMTKLKLMDKLQAIKKQIDEADKTDAQSEIAMSSCHSIGTLRQLPPENLTNSTSGQSLKRIEFNKSLNGIYGDLKDLKARTGRQNLQNDVKYLQKCKEKMERVQRKYFLRMLDIQ